MLIEAAFRVPTILCLAGCWIQTSGQCGTVLSADAPSLVLHVSTRTRIVENHVLTVLEPSIGSDSVDVAVDESLPRGQFIGFYRDSAQAVTVNSTSERFELTQRYRNGTVKHTLVRVKSKRRMTVEEKSFLFSGNPKEIYSKSDSLEEWLALTDFGDTLRYQANHFNRRNGLFAVDASSGCGSSTRTEFYCFDRRTVVYRRYRDGTIVSHGMIPYKREISSLLWSVVE